MQDCPAVEEDVSCSKLVIVTPQVHTFGVLLFIPTRRQAGPQLEEALRHFSRRRRRRRSKVVLPGSSAATSSSSPTPTHTPACWWRGGSRDPAPHLLLAMIINIIVSWLARRDLRPFLLSSGKCWGVRDLEAVLSKHGAPT